MSTDHPSPARPTPPRPPVARTVNVRHERFGTSWDDPYAWLRDPGFPDVKDPEILAHLAAENDYLAAVTAGLQPEIGEIKAEMKAHMAPDDASVPVRREGFWYHWAFRDGAQYRTWFRRALEAAEPEVLLDEPALAASLDFFRCTGPMPAPDHRLVAYATDEDGSERFLIHLLDTADGGTTRSLATGTSGAVVWAADGRSFLYVELDPSLRPFRVRRHTIGAGGPDPVVYEESDPAYFVSIGRTRSRATVTITASTHVTAEVRLLDPSLEGPLRLIDARREGRWYEVDERHGTLWIRTDDTHPNFRLCRAPLSAPEPANWEEALPGSDERYLLGVDCFDGFLVRSERLDGLDRLVVAHTDGRERPIVFPEAVGDPGLGENPMFDTGTLRLGFSSMVTPPTVYDYHVAEERLEVRKVQRIPSGYQPERWRTERLWALADDGAKVPVSIVYPKDFPKDGSGRVLLTAYGSYGMGLSPSFGLQRLTYLERGVAVAIAHVRGGDELGRPWYFAGRREHKRNSFTDTIAAAEMLIRDGWTARGQIALQGGSAGGLLVGAVVTMRPDLWAAAVADVPFVDVLNTMSDPSLPLTPIEWPEWGDPITDEAAFRTILAYSPYDNVRPQAWPPMLVTAGLTDPRVGYWEPAKWVARIRATRTDDAPLLFKTNMGAGHFGKSGRYDALDERALVAAFILGQFHTT
ncbi:MAG TPA: S9 family peptidase [Geminicoccus sp.]|uniref:S9 family peptidase n=1 Tax=Geminicoccus sp. TaxID=2024832 RepID=UPI002B5433B6|nr:S9 family peptidase [Geminicoccus sp.]HWL68135.1 S9 family peptidase [Geminicoccus sp.]